MSYQAMRYKNRNRHHLTPRSRKKEPFFSEKDDSNLLLMDIEKHEYWHKTFKNRTIEEVVAVLLRVIRAKKRFPH